MAEDILKLKLIQIKNEDYIINGNKLYYSYALDMLRHIETTDSILRDDLIYDIFLKWIIQNRFSTEELKNILTISIDNQHLMKSVGIENDDTVFARTFSALIIALVLYSHNQNNFLANDEITKTKNIVIDYYTKEMDLRGYIDDKGWAHSVAHGADVIDELAQCSELDKEDLKKLLMVLKLKICQGKYVYIDGESDRISVAVRSIFMRTEIEESEISSWIDSFKEHSYIKDSSIEWYHQKINITNFLKGLYFALKGHIQEPMILDKIQDLVITL